MDPNRPQEGPSTPGLTVPNDPGATTVTSSTPPKSGASIWPLVLIGIIAVLWVIPGAAVVFLMAWGIEGDSPSHAQIQQASLVYQVWLLGLVGLIALWCGLAVRRYRRR